MAIYHFHLQTISRGKQRSAVVAAAYRSASKMAMTHVRNNKAANRRRGRSPDPDAPGSKIYDYRAKQGVLKTLILLPPGAPWEYTDRETLWNAAEDAERRYNAVVAREMDLALPHELGLEEQFACAHEFGEYLMNRYRVAVDIAHHQPSQKTGHDRRNYHAHIMFSSREIDASGFGKKTRILDKRPSGPIEVEAMRQAWQDIVNARLEKAGVDARIDCRTLEEQGIDHIPQIHVGVNGTAMEEQGIDPQSATRADFQGRKIDYEDIDRARSRSEFNAEIIELNARRDKFGPLPLAVQIKNIEGLIDLLMEKVTGLEAIIPRGLLPVWARAKLESAWIKAKTMIEAITLEKHEAEERRIRRERGGEGIHTHMRRMREEIERLVKDRERRQALQRLYTRIEVIVSMRPQVAAHGADIEQPPPRILTIEQYKVELLFKAETARAKVPPEYRPRIEVPEVIWDSDEQTQESSLGEHFREISQPADNGGMAEPPLPITEAFNTVAKPQTEQLYKIKVKLEFGLP